MSQECPPRRRPWGQPTTRWRDYVSQLPWEHIRVLSEELEEETVERDIWIKVLHMRPDSEQTAENGGMERKGLKKPVFITKS